jgi:hypothetical protein
MLRLPDVRGNPEIGSVGVEWFYPIVKAVFGSYDKESDLRRISEFFILISHAAAAVAGAFHGANPGGLTGPLAPAVRREAEEDWGRK